VRSRPRSVRGVIVTIPDWIVDAEGLTRLISIC
jgi:hypothetical protein